jgi:hypothetical protein
MTRPKTSAGRVTNAFPSVGTGAISICLILAGCGPPAVCVDVPAAYKGLQPLVLAQIVNPKSAVFPPVSAIRLTPVNTCEFVGAGYVDTRNDDGRALRTYYRAYIRLDRTAHAYKTISLDFSSL